VARVPDQPPEAAHEVALLDDQVKVAALPLGMVLGLATSATVGAGAVTETVVDCVALPPEPVQVSVYVAPAVNVPVEADPLNACAPLHPPDAMQDVALAAVQVRVDACPLATVLGLALKDTVAVAAGATVTVVDWLAFPPAPWHVRV
jgi:hypothetical protein